MYLLRRDAIIVSIVIKKKNRERERPALDLRAQRRRETLVDLSIPRREIGEWWKNGKHAAYEKGKCFCS